MGIVIQSGPFQQLKNATGNFQWLIYKGWNYTLYKGNHEDREISVKSFQRNRYSTLDRIANEVAIASRMSNHKNVLKFMGCCQETELPFLIYEFPANGNLESYIYTKNQQLQLPWDSRLRIATGIENAVAYLHHGLSKTIIHRNITPENVFLDQNNVVKLLDFQDALVVIPGDETDVDTMVCGTCWYLAPEVAMYGRQTEKYDVYSFGVLLSAVLTQKRFHDLLSWHREISNKHCLDSWLQSDHDFWEEIVPKYCEIYGQEESRAQVLECVKVVQSCIKENPDERSDMIEVGKALRLIKTI
ncbi:hypothetical protein TIFTF001_046118 [Ficus carica]|uniref:Protein kinase domain-containing protein n=1 Tax=Ficus carica TaxID=3494 RepID=A0AA88CRF5_FICCA|nr:hypothetical protein TIFTF001_046116 [Ficus carica]GMN27139.1 hypothetical protein TIFTF001_046118 [Ficus carica]